MSDSQKRAAYDQFGHAGVEQSAGMGGAGAGSFSDVFGDVIPAVSLKTSYRCSIANCSDAAAQERQSSAIGLQMTD